MEFNILIQGIIIAILIGMFYNIWVSSRAYGGIIGSAVKWLGLGMLFITISVIEKALLNYGIITANLELNLAQDILTLIGLFFLAIGFSTLARAAKT
ncbi:MAG: hypothetical protein HY395_00450 [Candidatus Doudnabacteria bacterium]|nr:hypothetical protein [Candidatus Doudnabacteria bacterium]